MRTSAAGGLLLVLICGMTAPPAAARGKKDLSPSTVSRMNRLQDNISANAFGRSLIALSRGVPRRPLKLEDGPFRYRIGDSPFVAVDGVMLAGLSDSEAELALVRELARAGLALPVEMPEIEMAAYQIEMLYALIKAKTDTAFARRLKKPFLKRKRKARFHKEYLRMRSRMGRDTEYPISEIPEGEFERLGYYLFLFSEGPDRFYWAIDHGLTYSPAAVRLTELKDFIQRFGPELRQHRAPAGALYVRIGGRRYPAALLRAAHTMILYGGIPKLDEVMGEFDITDPERLSRAIKRFTKGR